MASEDWWVATSLYNTAVTGPLSVTDMLLSVKDMLLSVTDMLLSHVIISDMDLVHIFGLSPHLDLRLSP